MEGKSPPFALVLLLLLSAAPSLAQQACPPVPLSPGRERIAFTEQQENDLSDAVAEHQEREFRVIDDRVADVLQRIGERLTAALAPSGRKFRFILADFADTNAFTIAGGRIYVSRKLVASTRTEDELAGVLGHELGHAVARHVAQAYAELFEKALKIREFGDRADIFEKYHRLLDNLRKTSGRGDTRKEYLEKEIEADRIAVYLLIRAGYDHSAFPAWWDRFTETKGRTGSRLGDFFGHTKIEERRLREMKKLAESLPESCRGARGALAEAEFQAWRAAVRDYTGLGHREALQGLHARYALRPPQRSDIQHLKFSPDGAYALAQDPSSIFVLRVKPFEFLFRVDAEDAFPAQFTPDSQSIVFYSKRLQVEKWSVADERRVASHLLAERKECWQSALAPDALTLACFTPGFDLVLYDVPTGEKIFERKKWIQRISWIQFLVLIAVFNDLLPPEKVTWITLGFSPDGRYFASSRGDDEVALDVRKRELLKLSRDVRSRLRRSFSFVGPDRIVGLAGDRGEDTAIVQFPHGQLGERLSTGNASAAAATRGNYLLLRPVDKFPVGVFDVGEKKIIRANRMVALDVYDDIVLGERTDGELELYPLRSDTAIARVQLPRSLLGPLNAVAVSPDMKRVALSEENRGSIWDVTTGERLFHMRGFQGVWFVGESQLLADFPEAGEAKRSVARIRLQPRQIVPGPPLEEKYVRQQGTVVVVTRTANPQKGVENKPAALEVRDAVSSELLWSRSYPKGAPRSFSSPQHNTLAMVHSFDPEFLLNAKLNEVSYSLADLAKRLPDKVRVEIVELRSGKPLGALQFDTGKGSYGIRSVLAAGDWVVVRETENRISLHQLSSGTLRGRTFGDEAAISPEAGLLCVANEPGVLRLYELNAFAMAPLERTRLTFSNRISYFQFSGDGKRLFVLTADQTAFILDTQLGPN